MRQPSRKVQYTIRGISAEVDAALRRKARSKGISLNRLLVGEISAAGGVHRRRSLDELKGKWREDPAFDRILAEQRA